MPRFHCPMCNNCRLPRIQLMLQHISRIHSSSPSFHITCGLDECLRTYTNYGSYQKHVKKMHSHYFGIAEESSGIITDNIIADDMSMAELDQEFNDEESTSCMVPPLSEIQKKCLRAKWVLKIRETNSLTQSCTEKLLNDITDMYADLIDELKVSRLTVVSRAAKQSRTRATTVCYYT